MQPSLLLFLGGVILISLTGVVTPGPLFAATLAKGQRHPLAGALTSLGHGLVEGPLVLLIWLGLGRYFGAPIFRGVVSILGGAVLVWIGVGMVRDRDREEAPADNTPYAATRAGLTATLANPYFFLWWTTVGTTLVLKASAFGRLGLLLFFIVHWLCDFGWSLFLSGVSYRAGQIWAGGVRRWVFGISGIMLVGFGLWFAWGGLPLSQP